MDALEYAGERLFGPLGIDEVAWKSYNARMIGLPEVAWTEVLEGVRARYGGYGHHDIAELVAREMSREGVRIWR
jgi:hypothetical protein